MPEKRFYPWTVDEGALDLNIYRVSAKNDDGSFSDYIDEEHKSVNLLGVPEWTQVILDCTVEDPNESLSADSDSGSHASGAELHLICRSSSCRKRIAIPMEPIGAGQWSGRVLVERSAWAGALTVTPVAVKSADPKAHQSQFGAHAHAKLIANGQNWSVYLDKKVVMPGGAIDGQWVSFSGHFDPRVAARSDSGWFLDLDDLEAPRLLLNEDIEGFKSALNVTATHGKNASLRNLVTQVFLQQILMELAMTSIRSLSGTDPEESEGWRKQMLMALARRIRGRSAEQVLKDWLETGEAADYGSIRDEVSLAVQRHLSTWEQARKAIKAVGSFEND